MGALDYWSGTASCPRCGLVHPCGGQTTFLSPDYSGHTSRGLRPGLIQPIDFDPAALREPLWDDYDDWIRLRPATRSDLIEVLVDISELFACPCGLPVAPVLRLDFGCTGHVKLVEVGLRDALGAEAVEVDFVRVESLLEFAGDHRAHRDGVLHLRDQDPQLRTARLREALSRRFPPGWERDGTGWMTWVRGPMRCAACGNTIDLSAPMILDHPVYFDRPWSGFASTTLRPGERHVDEGSWRADADRGQWFCLRYPAADRLVLLGAREAWSCRCGAGPLSLQLEFVAGPGWVALQQVVLRTIACTSDLQGVDFVCAPACSRAPYREPPPLWNPPTSRDEALQRLHQRWGLSPAP